LETVDEHLNQLLWVSVVDGFQQKGTHAAPSAAGNGMDQHKTLLGYQAPINAMDPKVVLKTPWSSRFNMHQSHFFVRNEWKIQVVFLLELVELSNMQCS